MAGAKRKASQEEIAHDASLRWYPEYHWGEALMTDSGEVVRFDCYVDQTTARLLNTTTLGVGADAVPLITLRRCSYTDFR